jgi:thiazole synthase
MKEDDDSWQLGARRFSSRLIAGTGKYATNDVALAALTEAGCEMVTVALRRVERVPGQPSVLDFIPRGALLLPNTAGCYTVDEALRTCRLARELGMAEFVKLEVIGDPRTLFPDNEATLTAARELVAEGFQVLPYVIDDPILCKKLQDLGCVAVMPLAAPIGSGLGIRNPHNLRLILEAVSVPVIVDAGVGTASDAALALELGCTAVLLNTGIAQARDPVRMARAMKHGVLAGREAFLAGRMPRRAHANASSPEAGLIE